MQIINDNGLLVKVHDGSRQCVGYIFNFQGRGAFDPDGKMTISGRDITQPEIDTHNRLLSEGEIKGLDENCQVGQSGMFYFTPKKGITTWIGVKVADYTLNPQQSVITFKRAGKTYRGRLQKDADCFNFKRIK
jgi:hypothetical protein